MEGAEGLGYTPASQSAGLVSGAISYHGPTEARAPGGTVLRIIRIRASPLLYIPARGRAGQPSQPATASGAGADVNVRLNVR
jgi:hypothetical protein